MRTGKTVGRLALLLAVGAMPGLASAADGVVGTEIHQTVRITEEVCTLTVLGGDLQLCVGGQATVGAVLQCGEGYAPVRDPQWYLDNVFLGTGTEITITPAAGAHNLLATCGSCQDEIRVDVQDESDCYWTPRLNAAFSSDATEATDGIFGVPSVAYTSSRPPTTSSVTSPLVRVSSTERVKGRMRYLR